MALVGGPLLVAVSAWLLFRLTVGLDESGAKMAARIAGVIGLTLVLLVGIAGFPAYGAGLTTLLLMVWCLLLLTPFVAAAAVVTAAVGWLRQRTPHSN